MKETIDSNTIGGFIGEEPVASLARRELGIHEQQRARLLARMAGNIAGGIEANPEFERMTITEVAERAVGIADVIAGRLGL